MNFQSDQERWAYASKLRDEGLNFREIGAKMCISGGRARELVINHNEQLKFNESWCVGLSKNTSCLLEKYGYTSKKSVLEAYQQGYLELIPMIGPVRYKEVLDWICYQ